jgi:hypothetical protein
MRRPRAEQKSERSLLAELPTVQRIPTIGDVRREGDSTHLVAFHLGLAAAGSPRCFFR